MGKRKKKVRTCADCGERVESKWFEHSIENTVCLCCSYKRRGAKRKGGNNVKWNGGQRVTAGYIYLLRPDHPMAAKSGYVKRANLVWEEATGHYPDWKNKRELLHHIDGDKRNDNIGNLQLMSSADHTSLHSSSEQHRGVNHPMYKHGRYAKKNK